MRNRSPSIHERKAAALRYQPEKDHAPVYLGMVHGKLVQRAIETAHDHGIPVIEDAYLTALLERLPVHTEIPEPMYQAVAHLYALCLKIKHKEATGT